MTIFIHVGLHNLYVIRVMIDMSLQYAPSNFLNTSIDDVMTEWYSVAVVAAISCALHSASLYNYSDKDHVARHVGSYRLSSYSHLDN